MKRELGVNGGGLSNSLFLIFNLQQRSVRDSWRQIQSICS